MADLSQRLVVEQTAQLKTTADTMVQRNRLTPEDLSDLLTRLQEIGLLDVGCLRASWLLHDKPYFPDTPLARELIADLLLAAALIARVTGTAALLFRTGIVEFRRGDRTVATHVFVSGRGTRSRIAIESELSLRRRRFRGLATPPTCAIVAGTYDTSTIQITTPPDILLGDTSTSILLGQSAMPIVHAESLRQNTAQCRQVVP
jgi:hypothetical protein